MRNRGSAEAGIIAVVFGFHEVEKRTHHVQQNSLKRTVRVVAHLLNKCYGTAGTNRDSDDQRVRLGVGQSHCGIKCPQRRYELGWMGLHFEIGAH